MFNAWNRLPREKRRLWGGIAGAITVGTVLKVVFFKVSSALIVDDTKRSNNDAHEHLRKVYKHAEWKAIDLDARLPKLTLEQHEQLQEFQVLVHKHFNDKVNQGHNPTDCTYDHPDLAKHGMAPPAPPGTVPPMPEGLKKR